MNISVEKAKEIRESIGAQHIIIYAIGPDGQQNVSSHGTTEHHAHIDARYANKLKALLGWPDELCQSTPAERADWKRKTVSQILVQIEALRKEGQEYADTREGIGWSPDTSDELDSLNTSMAQVDYAIQQLEWVIKSDNDAEQELPKLYPATLTPELDEVLGWPNFKCGGFADIFRLAGYEIPPKAEREQAFILHWLTSLVLKHGAGWRDQASIELAALRDKVKEKGNPQE